MTDQMSAPPTNQSKPDPEVVVDSQLSPARPDPWPTLFVEWEMVLLLDGGRVEHVVPVADEAEAEWTGSQLGSATWEVRRYWRSPSERVGPRRKNALVIEEVEVAPGVETYGKAMRW
jgi:hypothetical protein